MFESTEMTSMMIKTIVYISVMILYLGIGIFAKKQKQPVDLLRMPIDFHVEKIDDIKKYNFYIYRLFVIASLISFVFLIFEWFHPVVWKSSDVCLTMLIITNLFLIISIILMILKMKKKEGSSC